VLFCFLVNISLKLITDILLFVTFHFQLNYSFNSLFAGRSGLVGLGFSIRVSVTV